MFRMLMLFLARCLALSGVLAVAVLAALAVTPAPPPALHAGALPWLGAAVAAALAWALGGAAWWGTRSDPLARGGLALGAGVLGARALMGS